MQDRSLNPWVVLTVAGALLLVLLGAHIVYPRYDWRPLPDGRGVIVYDRWSGRFQRTEWSEAGKVTLSDVYTAP